ncbi:hypothetical protein EDB81DRAFT_755253 [Dactylonectria macrodidyma]|uniref:Uncharacterized protein n=1 Tax=Dactylonectria macrodidyma TaxID=307937 RepID=A0A9P9JGF1_9HYPO|nr:hypothetical protein EDB81DRAFT_755253 [Dactylonectria macrodidyma]
MSTVNTFDGVVRRQRLWFVGGPCYASSQCRGEGTWLSSRRRLFASTPTKQPADTIDGDSRRTALTEGQQQPNCSECIRRVLEPPYLQMGCIRCNSMLIRLKGRLCSHAHTRGFSLRRRNSGFRPCAVACRELGGWWTAGGPTRLGEQAWAADSQAANGDGQLGAPAFAPWAVGSVVAVFGGWCASTQPRLNPVVTVLGLCHSDDSFALFPSGVCDVSRRSLFGRPPSGAFRRGAVSTVTRLSSFPLPGSTPTGEEGGHSVLLDMPSTEANGRELRIWPIGWQMVDGGCQSIVYYSAVSICTSGVVSDVLLDDELNPRQMESRPSDASGVGLGCRCGQAWTDMQLRWAEPGLNASPPRLRWLRACLMGFPSTGDGCRKVKEDVKLNAGVE